jgi:hypothetical protein
MLSVFESAFKVSHQKPGQGWRFPFCRLTRVSEDARSIDSFSVDLKALSSSAVLQIVKFK